MPELPNGMALPLESRLGPCRLLSPFSDCGRDAVGEEGAVVSSWTLSLESVFVLEGESGPKRGILELLRFGYRGLGRSWFIRTCSDACGRFVGLGWSTVDLGITSASRPKGCELISELFLLSTGKGSLKSSGRTGAGDEGDGGAYECLEKADFAMFLNPLNVEVVGLSKDARSPGIEAMSEESLEPAAHLSIAEARCMSPSDALTVSSLPASDLCLDEDLQGRRVKLAIDQDLPLECDLSEAAPNDTRFSSSNPETERSRLCCL